MHTNEKVIVNADDLGLSPGVNEAVCQAHASGCVTHTSLLANGEYFEDAVSKLRTRSPGLHVGVHLNLTYGKGLHRSGLLAREDGTFRHGFIGLLVRSMLNRRILQDIEQELEAQVERLKQHQLVVEHMDSHRHIHMIPAIFRIVTRLSRKHSVSRIRIPNERFLDSLRIAGSLRFFRNGGLFKFVVLKILCLWNGVGARKGFFSVLYTGGVNTAMLERILSRNEAMEVAVHPGSPDIDKDVPFYDPGQKQYCCSLQRRKEFEACLLARLPNPTDKAP